MRTSTEITTAVRQGEPVTEKELRLVVCAYDVLLATMDLTLYDGHIKEFFKFGQSAPDKYVGWENDPRNPDAAAWHKDMVTRSNQSAKVIDAVAAESRQDP